MVGKLTEGDTVFLFFILSQGPSLGKLQLCQRPTSDITYTEVQRGPQVVPQFRSSSAKEAKQCCRNCLSDWLSNEDGLFMYRKSLHEAIR